MFKNKKYLTYLLSLCLAMPANVLPGLIEISGDKNAWKKLGIEVGIGVGAIAVVGFGLYVKLGGTKSFADYVKGAEVQANKALASKVEYLKQNMSKQAFKDAVNRPAPEDLTADELKIYKKYKILSIDDIREGRIKGYNKYVADQTARKLGVSSSEFTEYVNSVELSPGETDSIVTRLYKVQGIVDTMLAQPLKINPMQAGSKLSPFRAALKQAMNKKIKTAGQAGEEVTSWESIDPSISGPKGPSFGARAGEVAGDLAIRAGQGLSDVGSSIGSSIQSGAQTAASNARDFASASSETVSAYRSARSGFNGPQVSDSPQGKGSGGNYGPDLGGDSSPSISMGGTGSDPRVNTGNILSTASQSKGDIRINDARSAAISNSQRLANNNYRESVSDIQAASSDDGFPSTTKPSVDGSGSVVSGDETDILEPVA